MTIGEMKTNEAIQRMARDLASIAENGKKARKFVTCVDRNTQRIAFDPARVQYVSSNGKVTCIRFTDGCDILLEADDYPLEDVIKLIGAELA